MSKSYLIPGYRLDYESNLVITTQFTEKELEKINRDVYELVPEGTVIGYVTEFHKPCVMSVGNGKMVHNGHTAEYVIEAEGVMVKEDRWVGDLKPGTMSTEPMNSCGTQAYHRWGGYAGWTRNGNRKYPEGTEVTCTKCLKKQQKKS